MFLVLVTVSATVVVVAVALVIIAAAAAVIVIVVVIVVGHFLRLFPYDKRLSIVMDTRQHKRLSYHKWGWQANGSAPALHEEVNSSARM